MNQVPANEHRTPDTDIALQAELEEWSLVRRNIRRRLSRVAALAWFYISAALACGAFLLSRISMLLRTITEDTFVDDDTVSEWSQQAVGLISWTYLVAAILLFGLFLFAFAYIYDRLPAELQAFGFALPGVGGCTASTLLGEFWASMHRSTKYEDPPESALRAMGENARNPAVRRWARYSARRLEEGKTFHQVLNEFPVSDGSDTLAAVILEQPNANQRLTEVCHRAAELCHELAVSRASRAAQMISVLSVLTAAGVAGFALVSVLFTTYDMIQEFMYW